MKFSISLLIAIIGFLGLSAVALDFLTSYLAKPSRGVSYGISMYYLTAAISFTGGIALAATKWFGLRTPLALGVFFIFIWVIWLFPQPNFIVKIFVALAISLILAITMTVLLRIMKKLQFIEHSP